MGFFDIPLKPSTAVIFTITFGIAVDDSIHFLARYRIERKKNESEFYAIFTTVQRTGKAIILTSLILLAGFGVLITSQFDSTLLMGALTCFTIITAVIYDLLFLPALLYWKLKSEETKQKNVQMVTV
jgi:predicted RND superfamily exporter protein